MNAQLSNTQAITDAIHRDFGMITDVDAMIANGIDVSASAKAWIFLTKKKQLICYIDAASRLTLGDVRKMVSHIGLKPELFVPPKGRPNYFDELAEHEFRKVFPGRRSTGESDLAYYRTLAPYRPALVIVSEVKDGVIHQYDRDARGGWRPGVKFSYRRIKTS